jgi:putative ABC transport system permease protein
VDTDPLFKIYSDMEIPEGQKQAFLADRTGALAGDNLARRFGWNIGDKIPLKGALFDMDPNLTLDGIYSGGGDDGSTLYFHWQYFNEGMKKIFGPTVDFTGFYVIRAKSAALLASVSENVDALFRNSTAPTKTESEKAFLVGFLAMMGNVRMLVATICMVVIFTVVLVAANTMAMSIRERVREIGILKALGFRTSQILSLLLAESLFLAVSGTLLGVCGAKLFFGQINLTVITGGFIQGLRMTPGILGICISIGLFVGLVSAGIPAWHAARRRVVDALGEVG